MQQRRWKSFVRKFHCRFEPEASVAVAVERCWKQISLEECRELFETRHCSVPESRGHPSQVVVAVAVPAPFAIAPGPAEPPEQLYPV